MSVESNEIKEQVRNKYAGLARSMLDKRQSSSSCCGDAEVSNACCCCGSSQTTSLAPGAYSTEADELPGGVPSCSLGCGNPVELAELTPGEVVLDLGSGAGLDVFLAARRVGPAGKAIGLDMTDEMLALAESHRLQIGLENVEFIKGDIESIPLSDQTIDVVLSNCVINLAADKAQVLREAYRVLRPGGRLAVYDVVIDGRLPEDVLADVEAYTGCIAGALSVGDYERQLLSAGFDEVSINVGDTYFATPEGRAASAFIRGSKPV